ncbi:MAG: insulinase family protein [Candidatus Omnitrophica bacterium]|nr:insulinase family protein [Candidatus Omnitrophota bacterium]
MVVSAKRFILAVFLLSIAVATAFGAGRDTIEIKDEAVSRKVLDNGLVILAKKSLPDNLVTIDIKIRCGSALEGQYLGSGISHLLEHMVFKGTSSRKVGDIEREVKSYGGIINGSVSHNLTDYYIILPPEYLPQALAILKDMLLNSTIDPDELTKEKEVILKEIKMLNDDPAGRLGRLLNETAYMRHAYKFPTAGYEAKFGSLTREDLLKYYNTRYVPNRMVVTVVGGIDEADAVSAVEKEFGDFRPADYGITDATVIEPAQIQPREAEDEMEISLAYLAMGFHSTGILSEDLFAMDVLSMILGRGDNSRLSRVLRKDKKLVHDISAWNYTPVDPGLFVITAVLDRDKMAAAEGSIMKEIERLRKVPVDDKELNAAKRNVLSDYIATLATIDGQANDISTSYVLTGSEKFHRRYIKGVSGVTKGDIMNAAKKYLRFDNCTTARVTPPLDSPAEEAISRAPQAPPSGAEVKSAVLANGLKIFARQDKKVPMASITAAMLGGSSAENEFNNGISGLMSNLMLKGTRSRPDSGRIIGAIEEAGGGIGSFSGLNTFGITVSVLKPDLDLALDIMSDVLVNAVFSEEEIGKEKALVIASIRAEDDDILNTGINRLRKELFGKSAYGMRTGGEIAQVASIRRDEIEAFYQKYCVPNNMVIAVSGDVDPGKAIDKIKARFSRLKEKPFTAPSAGNLPDMAARSVSVTMDKEQSLLLIGFRTVPGKSPDRYALEVLSAVMSGSSGRLFEELRDRMSLGYMLGCWADFWTDTGICAFYIATSKDRLPDARKALLSEIEKLRSSDITDEELARAKKELSTRYRISMQDNGFYSINFALDELRGLGYGNLYGYDKAIDNVTKDDVRRAADTYLDPAKSAEVTVSPE